MNRRSPVVFTLLLLWFLLVLLACTLTSEPEPTLIPRATSTPPPTIGYSTLAPNQYPQQATQLAPIPSQPNVTLMGLTQQVDADRMFVTIDALVGMRTRRVNSAGAGAGQGIDTAAAYVLDQFNQIHNSSYQNTFSVFTNDFPINFDDQQSTGRNIIGVLQGSQVGGGVIVLGAHYDSISYNFNDSAAYAPGADDDASGIAALIEIARIMSQHRHRATIMFVAFSAEEIQRVGSKAFVSDYVQSNNININAMLNMDIIGSSTGPDGDINDKEVRVFSADNNDSRSRQLARALNLISVRLSPQMKIVVQAAVDRQGRYGDHMSFSDAGYPAVRFIEALEDFSRQHSDRDTIDDVQASYLVRVTQTILTCMTALADGPPAPQNISLREAGGGNRQLTWEKVAGAASYIVA
ncbi:MAG: M20/M25/M40 family metallo-hydrolase, partial [Chloroflexi bacterium]|nr:M20/M25/M40 family metallo-hydrolase [Chloroflexota bacterium]